MMSMISFVACSDDTRSAIDDGEWKPGTKLLPEIMEDPDFRYTLTYDDNNRLIAIKNKIISDYLLEVGTQREYNYKILYNEAGNPDSLICIITHVSNGKESFHSDTTTYTYDGLIVTRKHYYKKTRIDINQNGTIVVAERWNGLPTNPETTLSFYRDHYEYNESGDVKKILSTWSSDTKSSSALFDYDTKNGVLKHVNTPQWLLTTDLGYGTFAPQEPFETGVCFGITHNVVKSSRKMYSGKEVLRNFEITYNAAEFPTEIKAFYPAEPGAESSEPTAFNTKVTYKQAK